MIINGKDTVIKFGTYNYVPTTVEDTGKSLNCNEISNVFDTDEDMPLMPTQFEIDNLLESLSNQGRVDDIIKASK